MRVCWACSSEIGKTTGHAGAKAASRARSAEHLRRAPPRAEPRWTRRWRSLRGLDGGQQIDERPPAEPAQPEVAVDRPGPRPGRRAGIAARGVRGRRSMGSLRACVGSGRGGLGRCSGRACTRVWTRSTDQHREAAAGSAGRADPGSGRQVEARRSSLSPSECEDGGARSPAAAAGGERSARRDAGNAFGRKTTGGPLFDLILAAAGQHRVSRWFEFGNSWGGAWPKRRCGRSPRTAASGWRPTRRCSRRSSACGRGAARRSP